MTTIISNDAEMNMIDYPEAESLIGSETVKEIHNSLNESSNYLDELMTMCDNTSFPSGNTSISPLPDNLDDILNNTNESLGSQEVFKSDLDLYHSKYTSFSQEVDTLTKEGSATMNFVSA